MKHQQLALGPRDLLATIATEAQQTYEFNRESLATWLQSRRQQDTSSRDMTALITVLNPILDYLAAAVEPNNMAMRTWCLLYVVRPDLIEHESFNTASMRFGVSDESLRVYLKRLLAVIPAYKFVAPPPVGPKTLEHRRRIQRRAALKKAGAIMDQAGAIVRAEIEEARRGVATVQAPV